MLREINQTQTGNYCGFHLREVPRIVKSTETESRAGVAGGYGRGSREFVFNGDRVSVWEGEKVLEWMVVRVTQQ